jgi:hypothetical protein
MKTSWNIWVTLCVALYSVAFVGCASVQTGDQEPGEPPVGPPAKYENFTVRLNPANGTIDEPAQGNGHHGRGNGYVGFGLNVAGWTTFQIISESPWATCEAPRGGGAKRAKWVITRIEVSESGELKSDRSGKPKLVGQDFGTSVPDWVTVSIIDADPLDGVVFEADKDSAPTYVQVYNANAHSNEALGEKLIYYRIQMTRCSDGREVWADPAWGNDGRRGT